MFVKFQNRNINSDKIREFEVKENTIVITYVEDGDCIYYFTSEEQAKNEGLRLLKLLNNEKDK